MSRTETQAPSASRPLHNDAAAPRSITQGRYATRAYGVLLDSDCIHRLGTRLYEEVYPDRLAKMSPEEAREAVSAARAATLFEIPLLVYEVFPNIPQLQRSLMLMDDVNDTYLFVFKDDSSYSCARAHLDPEDVKAAKKLLGVPRQVAKWHPVDVCD